MTSTELVATDKAGIFGGLPNGELIARMDETRENVDHLDGEELLATLTNASAVEAAAHQIKAAHVERSAGRLRLYSERRLGVLSREGRLDRWDGDFSAKEMRDFRRLAQIPTTYKRRFPKVPGYPKHEVIDLFHDAVEHQLNGRSHTAYSVWLASLDISAQPGEGSVHECWDGSWKFYYQDAKTKAVRWSRVEGTREHAVEVRNILREKIRPEGESILKIKRTGDIGVALDHVRAARKIMGESWADLADVQKRTLDGAYGRLDDLATSIIQAIDLAP